MQIERNSPESILISSNTVKIYLNLAKEPLKVNDEENVIILGSTKDKKAYVINEPGEYELYDASIVALENAEVKKGIADFFQIELEGVFVTWQVNPLAEIAKDDWENLADTHLVILDLGDHAEEVKLDKFISKHNPHKLVVVNSEADNAEKATGIPVKETAKKFKFSNKDFTAEEFTTESILIG